MKKAFIIGNDLILLTELLACVFLIVQAIHPALYVQDITVPVLLTVLPRLYAALLCFLCVHWKSELILSIGTALLVTVLCILRISLKKKNAQCRRRCRTAAMGLIGADILIRLLPFFWNEVLSAEYEIPGMILWIVMFLFGVSRRTGRLTGDGCIIR